MKTVNYEQQAQDFLAKTNSKMTMEYIRHDFHFDGDKERRDIYKITLARGKRSFSLDFGQSIAHSSLGGAHYRTIHYIDKDVKVLREDNMQTRNKDLKQPSEYDVLACLQKHEVGTFENFCSDFGYDIDSRTAEKTYKAVCEEYKNLQALYSDRELELMQEIQ